MQAPSAHQEMNNQGRNSVLGSCPRREPATEHQFLGWSSQHEKNMLKEQAAQSSPPKYYKETTALQAFQVLIIRNQANKIAVSSELNSQIPTVNVQHLGTKSVMLYL